MVASSYPRRQTVQYCNCNRRHQRVLFVIDVYRNGIGLRLGSRSEPPLVTFPRSSGAHRINLGGIRSLQRIAILKLEYMSRRIAYRELNCCRQISDAARIRDGQYHASRVAQTVRIGSRHRDGRGAGCHAVMVKVLPPDNATVATAVSDESASLKVRTSSFASVKNGDISTTSESAPVTMLMRRYRGCHRCHILTGRGRCGRRGRRGRCGWCGRRGRRRFSRRSRGSRWADSTLARHHMSLPKTRSS